MINRRDFLKLGGALLAGGLISTKSTPAQAVPLDANIVYQGVNLKGWQVKLGDALYPPDDVFPSDIKTVHPTGYSELRANVNRRVIMAHNTTCKKIINPAALTSIHTCSVSFRLPYLPIPDTGAALNGQTVESGIFVWDGAKTRLDYGMAFQWIVNPWGDGAMPQGTLRVWSGSNWLQVGELTVDTNWHTLKMVVDFKRKNTLLLIDNKYQLSRFSKTPKDDSWGDTVDARFQVEAVSIDPRPDNIIQAMHRVQFKNWKWLWETA
ncbi:MAG TPA: hypothetical protein VI451_17735 [Anaerolineales bacterium]|nr:hypothetical protein [Anaerolineales bacterium]